MTAATSSMLGMDGPFHQLASFLLEIYIVMRYKFPAETPLVGDEIPLECLMMPAIFQGKRFQDVILLLLAIGLFASPWVLGFAEDEPAKWNAGVVGVIIAYIACASLSETKQWEEWVTVVLGGWLIAAPWALRFIVDVPASRLHWGIGGLAIVVSLWAEWTYRHPAKLSAR